MLTEEQLRKVQAKFEKWRRERIQRAKALIKVQKKNSSLQVQVDSLKAAIEMCSSKISDLRGRCARAEEDAKAAREENKILRSQIGFLLLMRKEEEEEGVEADEDDAAAAAAASSIMISSLNANDSSGSPNNKGPKLSNPQNMDRKTQNETLSMIRADHIRRMSQIGGGGTHQQQSTQPTPPPQQQLPHKSSSSSANAPNQKRTIETSGDGGDLGDNELEGKSRLPLPMPSDDDEDEDDAEKTSQRTDAEVGSSDARYCDLREPSNNNNNTPSTRPRHRHTQPAPADHHQQQQQERHQYRDPDVIKEGFMGIVLDIKTSTKYFRIQEKPASPTYLLAWHKSHKSNLIFYEGAIELVQSVKISFEPKSNTIMITHNSPAETTKIRPKTPQDAKEWVAVLNQCVKGELLSSKQKRDAFKK